MKKHEITLIRRTRDYVTVRIEGEHKEEAEAEVNRMLDEGWDPQDDVTAHDADTTFDEWGILVT